jgi:Pyridoxamine 5'-phosphate oxidase
VARTYDALAPELRTWIERQHVFFVATAPPHGGHVNVSPKGYDTFRILSPGEVAYLDLTGSGVETIAHLRHDGRITVMFCAFEGPPRIVRLYGRGCVHTPGDTRFDELVDRFGSHPGARAVITVELDRISSSCGYSLPLLSFEGERSTLDEWAVRKGEDGVHRYRAEHNRVSIDGLDALR